MPYQRKVKWPKTQLPLEPWFCTICNAEYPTKTEAKRCEQEHERKKKLEGE